MTIRKSSHSQKSMGKNSVAIFCDVQNAPKIKEMAKYLLDFAAITLGSVHYKKLYYNSSFKEQVSIKDKLKLLGFECVNVTDTSENSADYRLVADCVKLFAPQKFPIPNTVIIVSGDWDYAGLVSVLQAMGKRVIIFAQKGSASTKIAGLIGSSNFYFVDDLPDLLNNINKLQPDSLV
ncbi:NYN domain-containing protein [Anabaena azotica]|uniref:NYN domain-containing protein n=1 Tax=Anabaena azotica FACHB-119 TaxID=947527 RepID=A0ABR8D846_9NOST|nr:NYN domain-containing protein [Anabaena azotica]MBD2503342.1 NYN domain-containing protein [Anabaena azotica FACHB-119]